MTRYDPLLSLKQAVRSIQDDMENMGKLHERIQQLPVTGDGPATSPLIKDSPATDEMRQLWEAVSIIEKHISELNTDNQDLLAYPVHGDANIIGYYATIDTGSFNPVDDIEGKSRTLHSALIALADAITAGKDTPD